MEVTTSGRTPSPSNGGNDSRRDAPQNGGNDFRQDAPQNGGNDSRRDASQTEVTTSGGTPSPPNGGKSPAGSEITPLDDANANPYKIPGAPGRFFSKTAPAPGIFVFP